MDAASQDFWILTSVCEARVPMSWLLATNRAEVFNLPDVTFTPDQIVDSLEQLTIAGEIYVERVPWPSSGDGNGQEPRSRLSVTCAQIREYLTEEARTGRFTIYFGLAARGGERWERTARPNWHAFVDYWIDPTAGEGAISARDRTLVEHWLDAWPHLERCYEITSVTWQELRPWQATYWKVLPRGYEARIQMRKLSLSQEQIRQYKPPPQWVADLQRRASRWYSWPSDADGQSS